MASLYFHVPFTTHLSPYDDIYAEERRGPYTTYVQAVCTEMAHYAQKYNQPVIETLYVGGGVPSLLHEEEIYRLLNHAYKHFQMSKVEEMTIEVSPEHATYDVFSGLKSTGFNRLSLLIQSFFQEDLDELEMTFDVEQAESAIAVARRAGFENISVDLSLGLRGQSNVHWAANLERLVRASIPHISLVEVEGESLAGHNEDHFSFAMDYLEEHGYEHYEISHFALPGRRARHNEMYWNHGNVLGFGASAHSFWWNGLPAYRWNNVCHTRRYEALLQQRHIPIAHREARSLDDLAEEHIVLRLRTADGLDMNRLEERYGMDLLTEKIEELVALEQGGYIEPIRNQQIRLTRRGKMVCDSVTARLLPEAVS